MVRVGVRVSWVEGEGLTALGRFRLAVLLAPLPALLGALLVLVFVDTVEFGAPTHAEFVVAVLVADLG